MSAWVSSLMFEDASLYKRSKVIHSTTESEM